VKENPAFANQQHRPLNQESHRSACAIWLCTTATDVRKSFDGRAAEVCIRLGEEPLSDHWFTFINRRCTQIKVLTFEAGGYCLWSKRLEAGQFARLGREADIKRTLMPTHFVALL